VQNEHLSDGLDQSKSDALRLHDDLTAAQEALCMANAHQQSDAAYAETKLLKDMRRRVAAHTQEAAVAKMHTEALETECAQARARLAAHESAHHAERETLTAELADLRVKCSLRVKASDEAAAQLDAALQARRFIEQQLASVQAQAAEAAAALEARACAAEERAGQLDLAARAYELEAEQQHQQIQALKSQADRLSQQVCFNGLALPTLLSPLCCLL
jgi:chromosome segregation ATPase